jgi:hypothetical protein
VESIREPMVSDIIGCSNASQALEMTCSIGVKSKIKSTFFLNSYHVVFLRHCMSMRKWVVPRKSARLGGVASSVVKYVKH